LKWLVNIIALVKLKVKHYYKAVQEHIGLLSGCFLSVSQNFLNKIKTIFNIYNFGISIYLSLGILFSQLFNVYSYNSRGATKLMTWVKTLGIYNYEPSVDLVVIICILIAIVNYVFSKLILMNKQSYNGIKIFKKGLFISIIICLISQIIFSSAMRFAYEFSFCLVVIFTIIIQNSFLKKPSNLKDEYQELWDLLKFIVPLCISFPVLLGGSGLITSFYTEQEFIQLQLYRHISMSLYFVLGTIIFIVYPLLKKILELRESN